MKASNSAAGSDTLLDGKAKGAIQLGLTEFFIAKRAAYKLKAFWKRHLIETEIREAEAKQQMTAEKEALKEVQK